jgi:hypothetical protein|nr:MAG TPA: hypothetical protein [Caudoviricetes sp.]DAP73550.1 MAG TPA: hypothetical protein [Caudoviricetes sp.]DAU59865.1 MAG TPA: hypothetical protein [Caudoviricetes sp.]
MTEKEALLWVLGILGSLCAAVITIDKVLDIIHKYVKNAQAPDDAQNKRMDTLEKRLGVLEQGQLQHAQALARDLRRFDGLDEEMRLVLVGVQNLLDSQLSGNNREGMQKSKSDINNYLLKGVTNHGSNV